MENKVYVYENDSGMDIVLSPRELTEEERYCPVCDEYATLLVETTDINDMIKLFPNYGYTPNTAMYKDLITEFHNILGGADGRFYNKENK